ncbi:MAG: CPBP family intramembrane glutamic endopeptidase [Bacteriovorax sp.]|jgi:membrane protease YdiL (CAAX protease family)
MLWNYKKLTAGILLIGFLLLKVLEETTWKSFSPYYSYLLELLFIFIVHYVFKDNIRLWKNFDKSDWGMSLVALLAGLLVCKLTPSLGLIIPFDFSSIETLLFLLIVAPVLEEFLFRMALWETLKTFWDNGWFLIAATSSLFSLGHFSAYWFVPDEFKNFVLYQSVYVIFLAILLGRQRLKTNSLNVPVMMHFGFNLGFYLGNVI